MQDEAAGLLHFRNTLHKTNISERNREQTLLLGEVVRTY